MAWMRPGAMRVCGTRRTLAAEGAVPEPNQSRRMAMRRSLPPRPTADGHADAARPTRMASRPLALVEREAPYMFNELKRIFLVTGTCVAVLIALTVVDRLR